MANNHFPTADKCEPIYRIDGKLYQQVSHATGNSDPDAIRAMVQRANGEHVVKWFKPIALPATEPAEA